jgi:hypothetical protein
VAAAIDSEIDARAIAQSARLRHTLASHGRCSTGTPAGR